MKGDIPLTHWVDQGDIIAPRLGTEMSHRRMKYEAFVLPDELPENIPSPCSTANLALNNRV